MHELKKCFPRYTFQIQIVNFNLSLLFATVCHPKLKIPEAQCCKKFTFVEVLSTVKFICEEVIDSIVLRCFLRNKIDDQKSSVKLICHFFRKRTVIGSNFFVQKWQMRLKIEKIINSST